MLEFSFRMLTHLDIELKETSKYTLKCVSKMLFLDEQINEATKSNSQLRCHLILSRGNIDVSEIT